MKGHFMLKKALPLSLLVLTLAGTVAAAESLSYCASDTETGDQCRKIKIQNKSSALVKTVIVTQRKTGNVCTRDERKLKDNLKRNDKFSVFLTPTCSYKIRFKTESPCSGDSTAYMTPNKFSKGMDTVLLKSDCYTLQTKVLKETNDQG